MRKTLFFIAVAALLSIPSLHAGVAIAAGGDADRYAVRDGALYVDGKAAKSDVTFNEINPARLTDTAVHFWAALDADGQGGWKALFFSKDGKLVASLPFDSEYACIDVFPSPDTLKVLVAGGQPTGPERDFTLYDLETATDEMSFVGMIGRDPIWVDGLRFAFTLVEATDEDRPFPESRGFTFTFSVMFYDTLSSEETVLKKATKTQDFTLIGISDDKGAAIIEETWVEKFEDWQDEDENRTKTREIMVEFPAAG